MPDNEKTQEMEDVSWAVGKFFFPFCFMSFLLIVFLVLGYSFSSQDGCHVTKDIPGDVECLLFSFFSFLFIILRFSFF